MEADSFELACEVRKGKFQILDYHSSDCGTEIVYARDTWSGPLGQMQEVLEAVTFWKVSARCTRSGYFVSEKLARGSEPQDKLDSSSCGSDDEEAPDCAENELASDALARWEPKEGLREQLLKCKVYRHRSTRFVHVVASEEEGDRFRCGRKISPSSCRTLSFQFADSAAGSKGEALAARRSAAWMCLDVLAATCLIKPKSLRSGNRRL